MMISILGGNQTIFAIAVPSNDSAGSMTSHCEFPQQQPTFAESNSASVVNQSGSLVLKDRIWISARQIDFSEASWWVSHVNNDSDVAPQPIISCMLLTQDNQAKIPKVTEAIEGVNRCEKGTETCVLPAGVSTGFQEYSISISKEEAESIANEVSFIGNKAIIQQRDDGKYYFLQLFTTNENIEPQAKIEFLDDTHFVQGKPIHLEKGQSTTIPFTVRTFATYGRPANITFVAGAHARDSGLAFRIEPSSTFSIPERNTAKANLTITAGANASEGIYRFFIAGKDGWIHTCGQYTDYVCPEIQVGNSTWEINTDSGGSGQGGKAPPDWLMVKTETDKDVYMKGEAITIKSFIVNNGNNTVTLDGARLFIDIGNKTVYADPNSSTTSPHILYAIHANRFRISDSDAILIPPHSKLMLARPFYWNRELAGSVTSEGPLLMTYGPGIGTGPVLVQAGNYSIYTSLSGYDGVVMYDNKSIEITTESYGDDFSTVSREEVWTYDGLQYPLMLGLGAAIAGVIVFLSLRKRK